MKHEIYYSVHKIQQLISLVKWITSVYGLVNVFLEDTSDIKR